MATAFERLKALATAAAAPLVSLETRVKSETGLAVVWDPPRDPVEEGISRHLLASTAPGDHASLARAFDQHFAARTRTGTGYRTYRVVQSLIMSEIEIAALGADKTRVQGALDSYAAWWLRERSDAAAAGCYARALVTAAYADANGQPRQASPEVLAHLKDTCRIARSVLDAAATDGRRHWLWRQADFLLAFVAWSAGEEGQEALLPAFAAVQTLDPHEFGIYDDRAIQLLPAWAGGTGAIEHFARASVDRTAAQFGELLYARIYDGVFASDAPDASGFDTARFFRGFADWYKRFPSQALANRIAAHAHVLGDDALVARLFSDALREIHPHHWFNERQPLAAWRRIQEQKTAKAVHQR